MKRISAVRVKSDAMLGRLRRLLAQRIGIAIATAVLVAAVATYWLVTQLAAPHIARLALARLAAPATATARTGNVSFAPFDLAFDLKDVEIDAAGVSFAARIVRVDFSWRSLVTTNPNLDSLQIVDGRLRADLRATSAGKALSMLQTFAADARIADLDAEITEAVFAANGNEVAAVDTIAAHGEAVDFGAASGSFVVTARDPFVAGSELEIEVVAEPAAAGTRLRGVAVLTGAGFRYGDWTVAAPHLAGSFEATRSAGAVAVSVAVANSTIVASDERAPDTRFVGRTGNLGATWDLEHGTGNLVASGPLERGGRAEIELAREANRAWRQRLSLAALPAAALAPYVQRAFGAMPRAGLIDVDVVGAPANPRVSSARVIANGLRLMEHDTSAETAIALLEAPDGESVIDVPLVGGRPVSEQIVEHARRTVAGLGAAPFTALAALVGRDAPTLQEIEFAPGTAQPTASGEAAIDALASALELRPRIRFAIEAGGDAEIDRTALARAQVELHVTLAIAAAERDAVRGAEIQFTSPRVQDVLDEFARQRLGPERLAELAARFGPTPETPGGSPARVGYYRAVLDALVASEPISDTALRRLVRFRANAITARLDTRGIARSRILEPTSSPIDDGEAVVLPLAVAPAALTAP